MSRDVQHLQKFSVDSISFEVRHLIIAMPSAWGKAPNLILCSSHQELLGHCTSMYASNHRLSIRLAERLGVPLKQPEDTHIMALRPDGERRARVSLSSIPTLRGVVVWTHYPLYLRRLSF